VEKRCQRYRAKLSKICLNCGEELMEKKPECPKCSSPLEIRKFVDTWDAEDNPLDVNEDLYCPKCDIRWIPERGPHHFYE